MLSKFSALLIAGLSATSTAQMLARLVHQSLEGRAVAPAGGFGLTANPCPNDLDVCGTGWCCPTSLTCIQTGGSSLSNICCPGTINCLATFQAAPYCADTTWSLWDQSTGGIVVHGYFCCAPGQVGLLDGTCIASDAISSPTQEALALAPGGSVLSTVAASTSTVIATTNASIATVSETSTVPGSTSSVVLLTSSALSSSNITMSKSLSSSTSAKASISALGSSSNSVATSATSASSAAATSTKASEGTRYESFWSLLLVPGLAGVFAVNALLG